MPCPSAGTVTWQVALGTREHCLPGRELSERAGVAHPPPPQAAYRESLGWTGARCGGAGRRQGALNGNRGMQLGLNPLGDFGGLGFVPGHAAFQTPGGARRGSGRGTGRGQTVPLMGLLLRALPRSHGAGTPPDGWSLPEAPTLRSAARRRGLLAAMPLPPVSPGRPLARAQLLCVLLG